MLVFFGKKPLFVSGKLRSQLTNSVDRGLEGGLGVVAGCGIRLKGFLLCSELKSVLSRTLVARSMLK